MALQDDLLNVFLRGTEVQSWAMSEPAQLKPKELSAAEGEIPAQESPWWLSCDWGIFCESHRSLDSLQKHFEALRGKCEPGQCTQGKFCLCVLREGESRECISEWALEISPCLGTKQLEECHGLQRGNDLGNLLFKKSIKCYKTCLVSRENYGNRTRFTSNSSQAVDWCV